MRNNSMSLRILFTVSEDFRDGGAGVTGEVISRTTGISGGTPSPGGEATTAPPLVNKHKGRDPLHLPLPHPMTEWCAARLNVSVTSCNTHTPTPCSRHGRLTEANQSYQDFHVL